jgi:GNAT superfamily N-acetyltransferase
MTNDKIDIDVRLRPALMADAGAITALFWEHLESNPEYISHGEMQMGAALAPGVPAPDGRRIWQNYLEGCIASEEGLVLAAYNSAGIVGFAILTVGEDEGRRFGVLNDILIRRDHRGWGFGSELLAACFGWLRGLKIESCYLESGRGNHAAHAFFERHGFSLISHTFRAAVGQTSGEAASGRTERKNDGEYKHQKH